MPAATGQDQAPSFAQFMVDPGSTHSGGGVMRAVVRRRWAWTIVCAVLSAAGSSDNFVTSVWAQAHRSDEPVEFSQPTLTGDWGGLRSDLERKGVTFTLNYTNDFLANVRGGIGRGAIGIGAFQPQLDLDLGKLVGWDGGRFHTHGLITDVAGSAATEAGWANTMRTRAGRHHVRSSSSLQSSSRKSPGAGNTTVATRPAAISRSRSFASRGG